jgi:hypothetical protein
MRQGIKPQTHIGQGQIGQIRESEKRERKKGRKKERERKKERKKERERERALLYKPKGTPKV